MIVGKGQLRILQEPRQFYQALLDGIRGAKRRVFLSTLYVGSEEEELVRVLGECVRRNDRLEVSILVDALRGTREAPRPSCASLLSRLAHEHPRVQVRLFRTPSLSAWTERLVGKRLNEGWGLQHMKMYGFDDRMILSGANLSRDYFSTRQDRYHVFSSRQLVDHFHAIHNAVCSMSYSLQARAGGEFDLAWRNALVEPRMADFCQQTAAVVTPLLAAPTTGSETGQTHVAPIGQFTPLFPKGENRSTEHPAVVSLLRSLSAPPPSTWAFTAGYFNVEPELRSLLLAAHGDGSIITAAQEANGFFESPGISRHLPPAYLLLARAFLRDLEERGKERIRLLEWKDGVGTRGGATYHAKGIWRFDPGRAETIVGSSNYSRRSHDLDLEMNAKITTTDPDLIADLKQEVEHLEQHTTQLRLEDMKRIQIPLGVRIATYLLGGML